MNHNKRKKLEFNEKLRSILYLIWKFSIDHDYMPSYREIAERAGIVISLASYYTRQLQQLGYIEIIRGHARGLLLTDRTYALFGRPINPTPEKILQLENEINHKMHQLFGNFDASKNGFWADLEGNIVEISICGPELSFFPRSIIKIDTLKKLSFTNTRAVTLPPEIEKFKKLQWLDLRNNLLQYLPREIGSLENLTHLFLEKNNLTHIPSEVSKLRLLKELRITQNPLIEPPVIIASQDTKEILSYLGQLSQSISEHNEAKLVLIGDGQAGKSCLVNRLIFDSYQTTKRTEGIEVQPWIINAPTKYHEEIKLNVWDFGGQEIYHATHQFFLTKNSVYLLVWNARLTRYSEQIRYWLHTVEAHAEDSPIILVMTRCREIDAELNLSDIKERFPQVVGLVKVDNEDGTGIQFLKDLIRDTVWKLPNMRSKWINAWYKIRAELESNTEKCIEYKEFRIICEDNEIDEEQINLLDRYLHDIGVIIHFHDHGLNLMDMVILKPEWATNAVYKVLDSKIIQNQKGFLDHSSLGSIWNVQAYPISLQPKLLELMEAFGLAFEIPDIRKHLIPEHLTSIEPDYEWNYKDNLLFTYQYDFLPPGVITRLIALIHRELEYNYERIPLCWHEGATLRWKDSRALIKARKAENRINIRVIGHNRRELLAIIRREIDYINSFIRKIVISQLIPCPCSEGCKYTYNYMRLIEAEQKGVQKIQCQEKWKDIPLSLLLDGYETPSDRRKYKESTGSIEGDRPVFMAENINISQRKTTVKKEIHFQNSSVTGNLVISDVIKNSSILLNQTNIDEELRFLFRELYKEIEGIANKVTTEQKKLLTEMIRDAETLLKEASSESPRRQWYEISLEGLKKAAENIGSVAEPVLAIVLKLFSRLLQ